MITTVSEFIEEFKKAGISQIQKQDNDIKHTVTIGNIFEGLTSEILNRSIFDGLKLKIIRNSFIYNDSGKLSNEMDCMIVVGDGKKISFSDQYKYHIKDVIAVVQVKKRLYADGLDNAHHNLKSVIETAEPREGEMYMRKLQADAYKLLVGKNLPMTEDVINKPLREQMMFNLLLMQAFWPLRILIGYDGFQSEYSLREGFVSNLENAAAQGVKSGYSPISFPDLIICGNSSIIKNVGMPYGYPLQNDNEFYWGILTTTNERPIYALLEHIWTRLSYKFSLSSEIFGDDFAKEGVHPFISCKESALGNNRFGWEYYYNELSTKELSKPLSSIEWQPIEINEVEQSVLLPLTTKGKVNIDNELIAYLESNNYSINELIESFEQKRIAYLEDKNIILLMDEPIITFATNGKVYIGENKSGEMTRWIIKNS